MAHDSADLGAQVRELPGATGSDRSSRLDDRHRRTIERTLIVLGSVILALVVWKAFDVFLLLFAGILLAILLRAPAHWLAARARLDQRFAFAITVVLFLALAVALGFVLAPRIGDQIDELATRLPEATQAEKQSNQVI